MICYVITSTVSIGSFGAPFGNLALCCSKSKRSCHMKKRSEDLEELRPLIRELVLFCIERCPLGGGFGPDPVHVGPPRTTVRQLTGCWYCVWRVQLFVRLVFAVVFASCVGCENPSVPRSPGASPQKVQGGPWAPPPCGDESSETTPFLRRDFFVRVRWYGVG